MKVAVNRNPLVDGSMSTRRALVLAIKIATNHDLQHEANKVFALFDLWVKNEGKRSAVLRLKAVYQIVLNRSLGQEPFQPPFIATVRGFPRCIAYLEKYCTSPGGIQAVLSLLGYWRNVRAPGTPDLTPILADAKYQEYPVILENEITRNLPNEWRFTPNQLSPASHYFSTRFGPNGKLYTSLLDLKALEQDPNLLDSLTTILDLTESEDFSDYLDELRSVYAVDDTPTMTHSRLSVKQELGGKDRVFAIVDYFSQCALRPLHDRVSRILSTIPNDCTYDQGAASESLKSWTMGDEPIYSYDLSNATDRLPARLQRAVLEKLTGNRHFAESWEYLMTKRDFRFRSHTGIRYAVGQPMGAYSSWPLFALTHHLIVMCAARRVKVRQPEYFLLGDDICMRGSALAAEYCKILSDLGLEISRHKSVIGKVAEFAKRIYYQGGEVSPIPVKLIASSLRDSRLIVTLRLRLAQQSFHGMSKFDSVQSSLQASWVGSLPPKQQQQARILLACPSQGNEGLGPLLNLTGKTELQDSGPLLEDWRLCSTLTRYSYLVSAYAKERLRVMPAVGSAHCANYRPGLDSKGNSLKFPGLDTGHQDLHPVHAAHRLQFKAATKAHKALGKYWTALTQQGLSAKLPSVNLPDLRDLDPSYQKRLKLEATVTLKSWELFSKFLDHKMTNPELTFKEFLYSTQPGRKTLALKVATETLPDSDENI